MKEVRESQEKMRKDMKIRKEEERSRRQVVRQKTGGQVNWKRGMSRGKREINEKKM